MKEEWIQRKKGKIRKQRIFSDHGTRPQMIYMTPSSENFFVLLPQEGRAHMAMEERATVKTFSLETICPPKLPSLPGNGCRYGELICFQLSVFVHNF